MDIKAWAEQYSPPAAMMLDLLYVLNSFDEDDNEVATIFLNHWPKVRDFIRKENKNRKRKCTLDEYKVNWPPRTMFPKKHVEEIAYLGEQIQIGFYNIIQSICDYLSNTKHYQEVIDCSNDFLELFDLSEEDHFQFIGEIGSAMWSMNPEKGEDYFKEQLEKSGYNETLTGYYTLELMSAKRWDDAAKALKGYEDSKDLLIQDRFRWLKERK